MHEKLIRRSRRNLEASADAARWTSQLTDGLEKQAREVGYEGRLSQECLDELQTFFTGLLDAQYRHLRRKVEDRKAVHDFAKLHRQRRDELTKEIYGQLVKLRGLIRSLLGKRAERKLFGSGQKTPREPWELARVAHNVLGFLRQPRAQSHICRGLANEELWNAAVEKTSQPLGELWTVLHELVAMESDERAAVDRLHEAKERLLQAQLHVFRLQESLCVVSGREDLARDLRPSEPARRQRKKKRSEAVPAGQASERAAERPEQVAAIASETAPEAFESGSNTSKAVHSDAKALEPMRPPGGSVEAPAEVVSHPVRKVLKWIQAVPHRVREVPETPKTRGSKVHAA